MTTHSVKVMQWPLGLNELRSNKFHFTFFLLLFGKWLGFRRSYNSTSHFPFRLQMLIAHDHWTGENNRWCTGSLKDRLDSNRRFSPPRTQNWNSSEYQLKMKLYRSMLLKCLNSVKFFTFTICVFFAVNFMSSSPLRIDSFVVRFKWRWFQSSNVFNCTTIS